MKKSEITPLQSELKEVSFPPIDIDKHVAEVVAVVAKANEILEVKPTNPKDVLGVKKLPLHLIPSTAIALASLAHLDGALKYTPYNWRKAGVRASVYIDACLRHVLLWADGEEQASDSKVSHLGHAIACLNILVDAKACGKLVDDRPTPANLSEWFATLTPEVGRLQEASAVRTSSESK